MRGNPSGPLTSFREKEIANQAERAHGSSMHQEGAGAEPLAKGGRA
jgi:hypothetical protein